MDGGKGIYVGGTLISILISLALYFSGKRESAILPPDMRWMKIVL